MAVAIAHTVNSTNHKIVYTCFIFHNNYADQLMSFKDYAIPICKQEY